MRKISGLSQKILRELYWYREMSSPEIAKFYNCHQTTIRRRLKKYGTRIRTMSEAMKIFEGVNISKRTLRRLYSDKEMTTYEIAKKFNCCQGTVCNKLLEYRIPIRTISEASVLIKPRYSRKNFSGNLEEKRISSDFEWEIFLSIQKVKTAPLFMLEQVQPSLSLFA